MRQQGGCERTDASVQAVDCLLDKWDAAYRSLEMAEARLAQAKDGKRPTHRLGCCGCRGEAGRGNSPNRKLASMRSLQTLSLMASWQAIRRHRARVSTSLSGL